MMPFPELFVVLFVPAFVLFWIGMCALMAKLSGWQKLAERFPWRQTAGGETFRMASAAIGKSSAFPVNYKNCLTIVVGRSGLALSLFFAFRILSPPLLIPWSQLESVTLEKAWFGRHVSILIRGSPIRIGVRGAAADTIETAYRNFSSAAA
jgi:hypothetical protein